MDKRVGRFLRQGMTDPLKQSEAAQVRKVRGDLRLRLGWIDPIVGAAERNCRHGDGRLGRQTLLQLFERRIASDGADPVAVGVEHHIDEVGIIEGFGSAVEGGVAELPGGREVAPQGAAKAPPVIGQRRPSAF